MRKCGKGKESVEEGRKGGDKKFPVQILSPGKHALPEKKDHIQPSMPVKAIQLEPSQHHMEANACN